MIQVYWANADKRIIRLDYHPPIVSWDEYHEAVEHSCEMAGSVPHAVCILHNPGHSSMPSGNPLEQLSIAAKKTPTNVDCILMVIHNRVARRIVNSALYIAGLKPQYQMVQSVEDAEAFLSAELLSPR